jgi:hypothetical protein
VPVRPPAPSQSRQPAEYQGPGRRGDAPFLELHPTASLIEIYSDNFNLGGGAGSSRTENFRTTLEAGFNALINGASTQGIVVLRGGASHDSSQPDDLVSLYTYSLVTTIQQTFTPRLSLTLTDALSHSDEPTEGDVGGLRTGRREFTRNTGSLTLDWLIDRIATQAYYRLTTFFSDVETVSHIVGANATVPIGAADSVRLGYEYSTRETQGLSATTETTTGSTATATAAGRATSRTTVGHRGLASYNHQFTEFLTGGVSATYSVQSASGTGTGATTGTGGTSDRDTTIWNLSLNTAYSSPAGLALSGSAGYSQIRTSQGKTAHSFTTNSLLAYRWAAAALLLAASQDFRQTGEEGQDFGTVATRSLSGTFSYDFTPFVTGLIRTAYNRNESTGADNDAGDRATTTLTAGATLSWQIATWLRLTLDYSHIHRSSDRKTQLTTGGDSDRTRTGERPRSDGDENRATLNLTATF